ncbi:hypothetical protein F4780DRAFT_573428 [Xylariomycetidae sp. FL0641]|nr:hypothetical protein F4780DRAFT_573428 [Xylariomycetidae sp. FL0641]
MQSWLLRYLFLSVTPRILSLAPKPKANMEVVGGMASVIQLGSLVCTMSDTVWRIREELRNAPARLRKRTIALDSISSVLCTIQCLDPCYSDDLQSSLRVAEETFQELQHLLRKNTSYLDSPLASRLWRLYSFHHRERAIFEAFGDLERESTTLLLHIAAAQNISLNQIRHIVTQVRTSIQKGTMPSSRRGPDATPGRNDNAGRHHESVGPHETASMSNSGRRLDAVPARNDNAGPRGTASMNDSAQQRGPISDLGPVLNGSSVGYFLVRNNMQHQGGPAMTIGSRYTNGQQGSQLPPTTTRYAVADNNMIGEVRVGDDVAYAIQGQQSG